MRFRTSLAALMLLVAFVGIGAAALRNASDLWSGTLLLITLGMVCAACLGVVYRRDGVRAAWLGAVLFGTGYLVLATSPQATPTLPTSRVLAILHDRLSPRPIAVSASPPSATQLPASPLTINDSLAPNGTKLRVMTFKFVTVSGNEEAFQAVGHCLLAWVAAGMGAGLARWFWATRKEGASSSMQ